MSHVFVGAAALAPTPVWVKAVMVREGDDVVTRCCVVTQGQFFPITVRVNVPQLVAFMRARGLIPPAQDGVSGFGSWLKKAVKKVTKSKVFKAVTSVVKSVVNSPIVQMALPPVAMAKGVISAAKGVVQFVKKPSLSALGSIGLGALKFVSPQAGTALGIGLKTVNIAKAGSAIASVARQAQSQVNLGKKVAQVINARKVAPAQMVRARSLVQRAVTTRAKVVKAAPALAKKAVQSSKVKAQLAVIAQKAKTGNKDARLAASVIARSSKAFDTIERLKQANAGGVPGLLVTPQGQIVRSKKSGKFLLKSSTAAKDILYRGPGQPTLRGQFVVSGNASDDDLFDDGEPLISGIDYTETVDTSDLVEGVGFDQRGPEWGGYDDPSDQIEGPRYRVPVPGGGWQLDDYSQVGARHGSRQSKARVKRPRPYEPGVSRLKGELQECGDAYDELWQDYVDMTGQPRSRYDDPRVIDAQVGALTP